MNVYENLKNNLRGLRESRGMTQAALSQATSIPRANLGRYETGENVPPLDILVKLAQYYDVTLEELLGLENY